MKKITVFYISCLLGLVCSCSDFLALSPDVKIATPETYADLRALLSDEFTINRFALGQLEMGVDDYFVPYSNWVALNAFDQDMYLWKPHYLYLKDGLNNFWTSPYRPIAVANIVLETLVRNKLEETQQGQQLKGEALFIRSFQTFQLNLVFSPTYHSATATTDLAPPLRLSSSIDLLSRRGTVAESYAQIIADLKEAEALLSNRSEQLTRASKFSVQALLARVYLAMGDYPQALYYADAVLTAYPHLLDFNELTTIDKVDPFPVMENPEVLYYATSFAGNRLIYSSTANVDTTLYKSFSSDDLRKTAFFSQRADGYQLFKGFYSGTEVSMFVGMATNELYLIKAECLMRLDKLQEGMDVLNQLLVKRWKSGTFTPFLISDKSSTLKLLYIERRKELIRRGLRWMDLKRLNREPEFAKTLVRKMRIDGKEEIYELPPNDLRYVHLIPEDVIQYTGIPQNPR